MKLTTFTRFLALSLVLISCAGSPSAATVVINPPTQPPQTETLPPPPAIRTNTPEPTQPEATQPPASNPPETGGPLAEAAATLGVSEGDLSAALGDPNQGPPNLAEAAGVLGVSEQQLAEALGVPLPNQPTDNQGQPPSGEQGGQPSTPAGQQPGGQATNNQQITTTGNVILTPSSQATAIVTDNGVDQTQLPIGDYQVSDGPLAGYVWSCQTEFNGGGAFTTGAWFNEAAGTYDLTAKPSVDGSVTWPSEFTITLSGDTRIIASNDLPNHATGTYPISQSDDAYNYDRNPHAISSQSVQFELPANPTLANQPSCVGGTIGILLTGSLIFNSFDAGGRDAVAHEIQDACDGHPQSSGVYHYHSLTGCLSDSASGHSPLMGYAYDGFGIYGHHGEDGQEITNADLDACHGHTHRIEWDGQQAEMYHYHATYEFPYVIGCFRGTAIRGGSGDEGQTGGGQGQTGGGGEQPPSGGQGGQPPAGGQPPSGGPPPGGSPPPPQGAP